MPSVSLQVMVTVAVGLIVILTGAAVWVPAALMAHESLETSAEDNLRATAERMGEEVRAYFSHASRTALHYTALYNASFAVAPDGAPGYFREHFGRAVWSSLRHSPALASLLVAHLMDPAKVNRSIGSVCDVDFYLISQGYSAEMNANIAGRESCPKNETLPCAGHARMLRLMGDKNRADPTRPAGTLFDRRCDEWLGWSGFLWPMQNLPGDLGRQDSGVREPEWLDGLVIVGKYPADAVYKKVMVNIPGPPWAPESGFAALSLRVGNATISDQTGSVNVLQMLEKAAERTKQDDVLFILTEQGELFATSTGFPVERRTAEGPLLGLVRGDNESVPEPIRGVATSLISSHCPSGREKEAGRCQWGGVPRLLKQGGYWVATEVVDDPNARGLHLLLVNMVRGDDELRPATRLNQHLAAIASGVLVVCCLAAVGFARWLSVPVKHMAYSMEQAASMKDLEEVVLSTTLQATLVNELHLMRVALVRLVQHLIEYKSYLPSSMFAHEEESEEERGSAGNVSNTKSSSSQKTSTGHVQVQSKVGGMQVTQIGMRTKRATVLCISLSSCEVESVDAAEYAREHHRYITMIAAESEAAKGVVDHFNADRVLVSWNASVLRGSPSVLASQMANRLVSSYPLAVPCEAIFGGGLAMGIASGMLICGNTGTDKLRAFNICGTPLALAWKCSEFAGCMLRRLEPQCRALALANRHVIMDCVGRFVVKGFGVVSLGVKSFHVYEIVGERYCGGSAEWMYELNTKEVEQDEKADTAFFALLEAPEEFDELRGPAEERLRRLSITEREQLAQYQWH